MGIKTTWGAIGRKLGIKAPEDVIEVAEDAEGQDDAAPVAAPASAPAGLHKPGPAPHAIQEGRPATDPDILARLRAAEERAAKAEADAAAARQDSEARAEADRIARVKQAGARVEALASREIAAGRLLPARRKAFVDRMGVFAQDDLDSPVEDFDRLEYLAGLQERQPAHSLLRERVLASDGTDPATGRRVGILDSLDASDPDASDPFGVSPEEQARRYAARQGIKANGHGNGHAAR